MMNPDKVYSSLIDHQTHSSSRFPRWHYCFNRSTIEIPSLPIKKKEKDIQLCDFFISFSHTFPNKKKTSKKITKICFNECNDFPKQATRTVATRKPREREMRRKLVGWNYRFNGFNWRFFNHLNERDNFEWMKRISKYLFEEGIQFRHIGCVYWKSFIGITILLEKRRKRKICEWIVFFTIKISSQLNKFAKFDFRL